MLAKSTFARKFVVVDGTEEQWKTMYKGPAFGNILYDSAHTLDGEFSHQFYPRLYVLDSKNRILKLQRFREPIGLFLEGYIK